MQDAEDIPRVSRPQPTMFAEPLPEHSFPTKAVAIAATAVVILLAVLVALARRHGPITPVSSIMPSAAYASNLELTDLHMSDATSGSGGRLIYIEGHIANHGPATLAGITVQLVFSNDVAMLPQIETLPLSLIYMREPYVDTHLVSAAPMAPGAQGDFRLTLDDVNDNWNQQLPQLHVTQVLTK